MKYDSIQIPARQKRKLSRRLNTDLKKYAGTVGNTKDQGQYVINTQRRCYKPQLMQKRTKRKNRMLLSFLNSPVIM